MWGSSNGTRVVNLVTQEGGYEHGARPGKATLKYVRDSLKALIKIIKKEAIISIALPKLATGVGGLEWDDVLPIIEEKLGGLEIPVYLYTDFRAGLQAKEPAS